jgi:outer membrane immunogenic protein
MKFVALTVSILALSAASASAADMAVKARPMAVSPTYDWTGFYIGVNAGGAWGDDPVRYNPTFFPDPTGFGTFLNGIGSPNFHPTGFTGGGQAGYNWQVSNWVFGIEADIEYARLSSAQTSPTVTLPGIQPLFFQSSVSSNWMATVRPRLGYAFDRALLYVTGGLAVADVNAAQTLMFIGPTFINSGNTSSTRTGWTVGGGVEFGLAPRWSFKAEYLHTDLGTVSLVRSRTDVPVLTTNTSAAFHTDIVRAGINYNFGGGPVVAKY